MLCLLRMSSLVSSFHFAFDFTVLFKMAKRWTHCEHNKRWTSRWDPDRCFSQESVDQTEAKMQKTKTKKTLVVTNEIPIRCSCRSVSALGLSVILDNFLLTYYPVEYIQTQKCDIDKVLLFFFRFALFFLCMTIIMSITLTLPVCNFWKVFFAKPK